MITIDEQKATNISLSGIVLVRKKKFSFGFGKFTKIIEL